jgi:hypothetical protein
MKFVTIPAVVMFVGACWCSFSLLMSATKRSSALRWYNRTIHFLGSILMAAVAIGGLYLMATGQLHSK